MGVPLEMDVHVYQDVRGRSPFGEWITSLRDRTAAAKIRVRLARVRLGNLGDCRGLGGGVSELRIDYGPGYRVYFGQRGARIIVLLCGGEKDTQAEDVNTVREYWADYRRRTREGG